MKVLTIIVTYNGMNWIDQCLKSVVNQSGVVVVDNNSSDQTTNFIKNNYPNVHLLELDENLGFGKANNVGISYALDNMADFVFLLNQDTIIEQETIKNLLETAVQNPDFGIISPIHSNGDGSSLDLSFLYYINHQCPSLVSDSVLNNKRKDIYQIEMINAAAWFVPRKTFDIVGGFDPIFFLYGEDDNFCQRVHYHKLKIGITPSTTIKHDSGNNFKVDFPKGSKNFYNKFLNRIKVQYGNVNSEDFRKLKKLKRHFLKSAFLDLVKFNFAEFQINKNKYNLIDEKSIRLSVLNNRIAGKKYLL